MRKHWQIWIDVGGTFTDCLARAPDGELMTHKVLSTGVYKLAVAAGASTTFVPLAAGADFPPRYFDGFTCQGVKVQAFDKRARTLTFAAPLGLVITLVKRTITRSLTLTDFASTANSIVVVGLT